ncbi:MAG: hypothetical protein WD341_06185 [Tistlia sp.]|uniref:hypothetical protein n=1 Tax=Tistlia sp. TaxID=3057121 RepID=UPI0034A3A566
MPDAAALADVQAVVAALAGLRLPATNLTEAEVVAAVEARLLEAGLRFRREVSFGPRCRADLWRGGIVIEAKRAFADRTALLRQLSRYALQPSVRGLVAVAEAGLPAPGRLAGKPLACVALHRAWGIAV